MIIKPNSSFERTCAGKPKRTEIHREEVRPMHEGWTRIASKTVGALRTYSFYRSGH